MLQTREGFTPAGARQYMNVLNKKRKELVETRNSCMKRKKGDHPRYANMTDSEFHDYKVSNFRWFAREIEKLDERIKDLEKYMEQNRL